MNFLINYDFQNLVNFKIFTVLLVLSVKHIIKILITLYNSFLLILSSLK